MKLYAFSSSSLTNVWAGVGAQMWAVPLSGSAPSNAGRATKAAKMPLGAAGILYSSPDKCFTCPFIIQSAPSDDVLEHIWPGKWTLPFSIRTLGDPHKRLSWTEAREILPSCKAGKPLNKLIHVEPLTVFSASEISDADWSILVSRLT